MQLRQYGKIRHRTQRSGYKSQGGEAVEYLCPVCDSRARVRTLRALWPQLALARGDTRSGKALLVSTAKGERRMFAERFQSVLHVSLQGDHGDPDCVTGVDITRMPTIASGEYAFAYACAVLDYIPKVHRAFEEVHRVLEPGGTFLFFIQPWRLVRRNITVEVVGTNALSYEDYEVVNEKGESGIPDCRFGIFWLFDQMIATGFTPDLHSVYDPFGHMLMPWFEARKSA